MANYYDLESGSVRVTWLAGAGPVRAGSPPGILTYAKGGTDADVSDLQISTTPLGTVVSALVGHGPLPAEQNYFALFLPPVQGSGTVPVETVGISGSTRGVATTAAGQLISYSTVKLHGTATTRVIPL